MLVDSAIVLMLIVLSNALAAPPDRSRWEWKLGNLNDGTLFIRPSPNHNWGTVCRDGLTNGFAQAMCAELGYHAKIAELYGAPGPETSPRYLDDASCPTTGNFSVANCTWWAGDAEVVGPGLPPSDCLHSEDVGIRCRNAPQDMQFRVVPFKGLPATSRTGTLEARSLPSQPWSRVVAKQSTFLSNFQFDGGFSTTICSKAYPSSNLTQNDAMLLPITNGLGVPSNESASNPRVAFAWQYSNWESGYVFLDSFDSNYADMTLSCDARMDVRLRGGSSPHNGFVEIGLDIPGLDNRSWVPVCSTSTFGDAAAGTTVCQALYGTDFAMSTNGSNPNRFVEVPPMQTYYTFDGYAQYPPTTGYGNVGGLYPSMGLSTSYRRNGSCLRALYVACVNVTAKFDVEFKVNFSGPGYKGGYLTGRPLADPSAEWMALPFDLPEDNFWLGLNICESVEIYGAVPSTTTFELAPTMGAYLRCEDVPKTKGGALLSKCFLKPRSNLPAIVMFNCSSASPSVGNVPRDSIGYEQPSTYEYKLDYPSVISTMAVGSLKMRGNSTMPWAWMCFKQAPSAHVSTRLCQHFFLGESISGSLTENTTATSLEEPLAGIALSTCPQVTAPISGPGDCRFEVALCGAGSKAPRYILQCALSSPPAYSFAPVGDDNNTGILQVVTTGGLKGYVSGIPSDYAEWMCAKVNLSSRPELGELALAQYFSQSLTGYGNPFSSLVSCSLPTTNFSSCFWEPVSVNKVGYPLLKCRHVPSVSAITNVSLANGTSPTNGIVQIRGAPNKPWARICWPLVGGAVLPNLICSEMFGATNVLSSYAQAVLESPTANITVETVSSVQCGGTSSSLSLGDCNVSTAFLLDLLCTPTELSCTLKSLNVTLVGGIHRPSVGVLVIKPSTESDDLYGVCITNFKKDQRLWFAACEAAGYPSSATGKKPHLTTRESPAAAALISMRSTLKFGAVELSSDCNAALASTAVNASTILLKCLQFAVPLSDFACRQSSAQVVLDCDPDDTRTTSTSPTLTLSVATPSTSLSPTISAPSSTPTRLLVPSPTSSKGPSVSFTKTPLTMCGGLPLFVLGATRIGAFPRGMSPANAAPTLTPNTASIWLGESPLGGGLRFSTSSSDVQSVVPRVCGATSAAMDVSYHKWSALADPSRPIDTDLSGAVPLFQDFSIVVAWGLPVPRGESSLEAVSVLSAWSGDEDQSGPSLAISHFRLVSVVANNNATAKLYQAYANGSWVSQESAPEEGNPVGARVSFRILFQERERMYQNVTVELSVRGGAVAASTFDLPPHQHEVTLILYLLPPPVPVTRETVGSVNSASGGVSVAGGGLVAPGVALQQGVAFALLRMAACAASDRDVSDEEVEPLAMTVHPLRFPVGRGFFKYYRGAVISNSVLIPSVLILLARFPMVALVQRLNRWLGEKDDVSHAMAAIGWPSVAVIPFVATVEGTVASSVSLLYGGMGNAVLGVMGVSLTCFVVAVWAWGLRNKFPSRASVKLTRTVFASSLEDATAKPSMRALLGAVRMWGPWYEWCPAPPKLDDMDLDDEGYTSGVAVTSNAFGRSTITNNSSLHTLLGTPLMRPVIDTDHSGGVGRLHLLIEIERMSHMVGDRWLIWAELICFVAGAVVGLFEGLEVTDSVGCRVRGVAALLVTILQSVAVLCTTVPVDILCAAVTGILSLLIAAAATAITFAPDSQAASDVLDIGALAGVAIGIVGIIAMMSAFVRFAVSFGYRIHYRHKELERQGLIAAESEGVVFFSSDSDMSNIELSSDASVTVSSAQVTPTLQPSTPLSSEKAPPPLLTSSTVHQQFLPQLTDFDEEAAAKRAEDDESEGEDDGPIDSDEEQYIKETIKRVDKLHAKKTDKNGTVFNNDDTTNVPYTAQKGGDL